MKPTLLRCAAAVALCAAALSAGCGDDSDGGDDATPTAPNAATAATNAASATAAPSATPPAPTATLVPPDADVAAAIERLVRESIAEYNASNWTAVIATYSACLKAAIVQGDELIAGLQKGRAESGAGTVTGFANLAVTGIYASASVTVERERTDPRAVTETYYFEREDGVWRLSTTFCQNLKTPVPAG